jgi:hypothetical protein
MTSFPFSVNLRILAILSCELMPGSGPDSFFCNPATNFANSSILDDLTKRYPAKLLFF